jgi:hypothetical protein
MIEAAKSTGPVTSGTSHQHTEDAHAIRYHGLLDRSTWKNWRDRGFRFLDYIGTMAAGRRKLLNIISVLTMAQIFIAATLPCHQKFWAEKEGLISLVIDILSVFAYIAPSSLSTESFNIVALVVEAVLLAFIVGSIVCFLVFLRISKVPSLFMTLFSVFFNGCLPLSLNVIACYAGRSLYGMASDVGSFGINIVVFLLSLILLSVLYFMQRYLVCPQLPFRPQSFAILFGEFVTCFLLFSALGEALLMFGSNRDDIVGSIIVYIGSLFFLAAGIILFIKDYCFATLETGMRLVTSLFVSFLAAVVFSTLSLLGEHVSEASLVVLAVFVVIMGILPQILLRMRVASITQLIADSTADLEYFDTLPYTSAVLVARTAFECGNPIAHRWEFFHRLFRRFVQDPNIYILYARYAAIYSDETRNLQEAASRLEEIKRGRLDRKHLLFAITATLHQRESHMSATIKRSLKKSKAKVEHIRSELRYLWECIIRGRIDELEGLTVDLRRAQGEITREYNQLCLIYPNNPYVARAYSSFLYQIANDEDAGDRMMYNSRQLRLGKRTRIERTYFFASRLFASLPSGEKHSELAAVQSQTQIAQRSVMAANSSSLIA